MKLKENFFYTYRETAKAEDSISGQLLVRSGMVKKVGAGIYIYHPMGLYVMQKITKIVREEMNKTGAVETLMPSLIPDDYYRKTNRIEVFGKDLFQLKDRFNRGFVLGPTHEELFALSAREVIKSYKDMPFNFYQIARKYRDEPRPRYGLIRIREFIMKDAYSFDKDLAGLDVAYQKMYDAYCNVFNRVGLDYKIVEADTGAMCGLYAEEFQAIANIGEDTLVLCDKCDYASNIDIGVSVVESGNDEDKLEYESLYTPNAGTIEEVTALVNKPLTKFVKTLIYRSDSDFYALLVRGDREINETKLKNLLAVNELELAEADDVIRITSAKVGYAGPIDLKIPVIIDTEVEKMTNFIVGANKSDYHFQNVNIRDFVVYKTADIKKVKEGDKCINCGGSIYFKKGIEIGNLFKLGDKYAKDFEVFYSDQSNNLVPVQMGSYGIGIERIMTSVVEQNHDDKGIIWPLAIAPFQIAIILINPENKKQNQVAETVYKELTKEYEVVFDNRDERPGVKFNDIDLIGIPIRITIGKKVDEDMVEIKTRDQKFDKIIKIDQLDKTINKLIKERQ